MPIGIVENKGSPWGGGGSGGGDGEGPWKQPGKGGGSGGGGRDPKIPDIDEAIRKGQEQLKVLFGGGGGGNNSGKKPSIGPSKGGIFLILALLLAFWAFNSFYRVSPGEQSVELLFGKEHAIKGEGLRFAPWPVITKELVDVQNLRTENIGDGTDDGLMLTGDENVVDIDFQVVWNIKNPANYLFELREPQDTIADVSESAMRDVIGRSRLAPILNKDRGVIAAEVQELIQSVLDDYNSGVNIVQVNLDRADPPRDVIAAFREVQSAEQERVTLQNQADAYANRVTAEARGKSEKILQDAEAYRSETVNLAEGEAQRFKSVFEEYSKAPDVTRKRLYLETMEKVLGGVNKVVIDQSADSGQGVVPYLPLNQLQNTTKPAAATGGAQ